MYRISSRRLLSAVASAVPEHVTSGAHLRLRAEALRLLETASMLDARYAYRFVTIDGVRDGRLFLAGETLEAPWLIPKSGQLTAVACCVATLGEGLEDRVRTLFTARRAALALVLDAIGNEILMVLTRRAQDHMLAAATGRGLSMAGELRSGDPGLALNTQRTILALAAADELGISLSGGCVMRPLKSTSMVLGAGIALLQVNWSRCDHCPSRLRCRVATSASVRT